MDKIQIETLKNKTASGIMFLSFRNLLIQAVSFIGFFILTYLLGTGDVGLFAIVSESIAVLSYFSDVGLSAALIQQKTEPSLLELRSSFTIQQILVLILTLITLLLFPGIFRSRNFGYTESFIFWSLCLAFILASFKTIPSVLMERKLDFRLLSAIDIAENITFYLVAVILAFTGYGPLAYAFAVIARSLIGLLMIYHYRPWSLGFSLSFVSIKKLMTFGLPFQFNSLIAMVKDRLSGLFVAGIVGREGFAFISWAQKGPRLPLSWMDAVMRVTFPAFSRLQNRRDLLRNSLEKSIFYISLIIFPSLAGISLISQDVIYLLPKYTKWLPAIIPLYLYSLNFAIASVTTPITNAFNAIGRITLTTRLMLMWTLLTWLFFPFFSWRYGYLGTALASLLVGLSSFIVWHLAFKIFSFNVWRHIFHPLLSSLIIIVLLISVNLLVANHLHRLIIKISVATGFYLLYHLYFSRPQINWFINQVKCQLKTGSSSSS